jgi:hypothetical protein
MAKFDATLFTWNSKDKKFVAEASELQKRFIFHRTGKYSGAFAAGQPGLVIKGRQHEVEYYVTKVDRSGEDIAGWNLIPTPDSLQRVPQAAGTSVLVIND